MSSVERLALRGRRPSGDVRRVSLPLNDWPRPSVAFFAVKGASEAEIKAAKLRHSRYQLNVKAVELYLGGMSPKEVNKELQELYGTTLTESSIWRMCARALRPDDSTGQIIGFWACVPQWRAAPTEKAAPKPSHHLSSLFLEFPRIEAKLCEFVLKRRTGPNMRPVGMLRPRMVWEVFLAECKEQTNRFKEKLWPFSEERCGYEAVRRWYKEQKYKHPSAAARNELPADLAKQIAGDYKSAAVIAAPSAHVSMAYSETQLDEHKMDQMWAMMVPGREPGEWLAVHTTRLWALCMVECASTAVLSSGVAFGAAYKTADVLRLIYSALHPPKRPERLRLSDEQWRYREDAAYPAELPAFARNSWMTLAMDRHSTHRAALADAMEVTRCEVVSGAPANPQVRDTIERFLKNIATHADWFESSVGNKPGSAARRDPEGGALRSVVYTPLAQEYLDILVRNYNVTAQVALDGNSPLGRLAVLAARGQVFRSPVGEFGTGNLYRLLPRYSARLRRRHSPTHGPLCVYFGYACYVGPELSQAQELWFGATQDVDIYPQEDARFAFVVPRAFPEKVYRVVCLGRWRQTPHTHSERVFSSKGARTKVFTDSAGGPLTGVGLARGLALAASSDEGLARLLSGMTAFMDRYGAGVVPYIDMTSEQIASLLDFAEKESDDTEVTEWAPTAVNVVPGSGQVPPSPSSDPFGLRG
ncbi:MAG: hypothetical protein H6933_11055 [Burkholderiaceae bacterium]|nr:hypothetical protein [Burkholderiaceae bacterium]